MIVNSAEHPRLLFTKSDEMRNRVRRLLREGFDQPTPVLVDGVLVEAILHRSSGKAPLRLLRGSQADGAVLPWERPARDEPPPFEMPDRLEGLSEPELYALARGGRFLCELEAIWKEIDRRRALGAEP